MTCGQSYPGSLPLFPAFLTVNPNARLAALHADVDVGLAPPTFEFGVAGLLARLTGSVLALASHCRQISSVSYCLGCLRICLLLEDAVSSNAPSG